MSKDSIKNEFRKLLLEGDGDTYDYGCVMLKLDFSDKDWKKVQDLIDDEDVYTKDGDIGYGREDAPHTTILYGLHDDIPDSDIESIVNDIDRFEINLAKIDIFENDDFDVVKFSVIGLAKKRLSELNDKFSELPHTNTYPDYKPHVTIAYVKSGTGKKYVKTLGKDSISTVPTKVRYSKPGDSNEVIYTLNNDGE